MQLGITLLQAIEKMFLVAPKHSIESSSPPLQGCRVLVTQSNESNQPVIQGMLDRLHCNYQVVDTGRQAIEAFDQQKGQFDILLIDSTLPDIDGYQVSEQIRELEIRHRFKPVTIISLTVHATSEHKDKCQAHGIDDHIGKPYTSNMLQYKLMQHFTKGFQVDEKIKETALSKS